MCVRIIIHHPESCGHRAVHIECCKTKFIPKSWQSSAYVMEYPVIRQITVNVGWECENCDIYLDDSTREKAYSSLVKATMPGGDATLRAIATISASTMTKVPEIVEVASVLDKDHAYIPGSLTLDRRPPVMCRIFSDNDTIYTAYGQPDPQEENPNQSELDGAIEDGVRAAEVEDTCLAGETSQPSAWHRQAKHRHQAALAVASSHGIKMPPPASLDIRTEFLGEGQAKNCDWGMEKRSVFKALRASSTESRSRRLARRNALIEKKNSN
ncbi:uncharacterized protein BP5553_04433 [Venustampulla echinocandica]|uniref:Uncharacterized protein n=1 Tax=Venustampulla echinocandica TaxID=2656787 RepID=A0A370TN96_9HELO|nr:uncharacterized protein BP5553_04433 [Venustampulla echinocandica]RDL37000.1 hypothetical protein BP5553_04433 [Venustampulla echinocandica]